MTVGASVARSVVDVNITQVFIYVCIYLLRLRWLTTAKEEKSFVGVKHSKYCLKVKYTKLNVASCILPLDYGPKH